VNATLHLYAMAITRLNSSDVRAVASGCPQCRNSVDHDGGFFLRGPAVVEILQRYIWKAHVISHGFSMTNPQLSISAFCTWNVLLSGIDSIWMSPTIPFLLPPSFGGQADPSKTEPTSSEGLSLRQPETQNISPHP